jgi:glutamate formiminotransferase / formiminotetrahydrofolate cyclodeaminase
MDPKIVECIPNFSEARRPEVIQQIQQSIAGVPGAHVLDRHSDSDHNRTVITFAGSPDAVEEAIFQAITTAGRLIDLNIHRGEHPRIGATDVVPFVPISGVTMQECIAMAKRVGERVGRELDIPVYLYEEAATREDRRNLENIRRGQFEVLKEEIGVNPDRKPDFGPEKVGPAGATVIGARQPLIAYNVFLATDDIKIAQKIARAVRFSSGGFRYVKAIGLLVDNRAQVSMNLTNYRRTPLAEVVEFIRREASRYGTSIHHSELVGLIPQEAISDAASWYLQLDDFSPEQILEQRLYQILSEPSSIPRENFLEQLEGDAPAPAGAAAAAHTAAVAAGLVGKIARLSLKNKESKPAGELLGVLKQSQRLQATLVAASDRDTRAFQDLLTARRLPHQTPEEAKCRTLAVEKAKVDTTSVPFEIVTAAVEVQKLAVTAAGWVNPSMITDAAGAALLAQSAMHAAVLTLQANLIEFQDRTLSAKFEDQVPSLQAQGLEHEHQLQTILKKRSNLHFQ